jgi:hypothetical protein
MYPASDWSVSCSEPSWISARMRSRYRTSLERASWVTSVRMRREDRSSIVVSSSRRPWRVKVLAMSSIAPFLRAVPLFVPGGRSFVPACGKGGAPRAGAVKAGRRAYLAVRESVSRPCLDWPEHGARIKQVGVPSHGSSRTRRRALCGEPPRRFGRACWRARSPARCGATAFSRPRSRA